MIVILYYVRVLDLFIDSDSTKISLSILNQEKPNSGVKHLLKSYAEVPDKANILELPDIRLKLREWLRSQLCGAQRE